MKDRLPPNAPELELGLLGCLMAEPVDGLGECLERGISVGSFYDLRNQAIYRAMLEMYEAREPIDCLTLYQSVKKTGKLEGCGGIGYLTKLQDELGSVLNLPYYIAGVLDAWRLRRLLSVCGEVEGMIREQKEKSQDILNTAERKILSIRDSGKEKETGTGELVQSSMLELERLWQQNGAISGLSTGYVDLDKLTDGLHEGEMIALAAFTSVGKSALAMNIAVHNALLGVPVGVFSLEMQPVQLMMRTLSSESRVNLYDIRDRKVNGNDFERLKDSAKTVQSSPLHILNVNNYTTGQLQSAVRKMKQKHGIKLAVVDYLQLLSHPGSDSREQEVSAISKCLKGIASEHKLPVLALSQLNDDGRLRESRSIGHDADSAWFLSVEGEKLPADQPVILRVDKNRNGPVGSVPLLFRKQYTRFESYSKIEDEDAPEPVPERQYEPYPD